MTSNIGGLLVIALAAAPLAAIPLALTAPPQKAAISVADRAMARPATAFGIALLNDTYRGPKRP